MIMFCHTCWNLQSCCTCETTARASHPTAQPVRFDPDCVWVRLGTGTVVSMTVEELTDVWLAIVEFDCRQAAGR